MIFIALIIALILERFLHIDSFIFRFNWFPAYLQMMQNTFEKTGLFSGAVGLIITILPIVVVVAIVYYLLWSFLWGVIGLLLATAILVYCLGPRDIYTQFEAYFVAVVRDDAAGKTLAVQNLLCTLPENPEEIPRALTKSVFNHFNYCIFTVAFWFLILGPLAAVLYRTIAEVHKYAHMRGSSFESMLPSATWALNVMDWLPIRILTLGFALMGDFQKSFAYWLKNMGNGLKENYKFVQQTGLVALGITLENNGSHDMAEIKSALNLIDRTLVLMVVIVALVVAGAVIY